MATPGLSMAQKPARYNGKQVFKVYTFVHLSKSTLSDVEHVNVSCASHGPEMCTHGLADGPRAPRRSPFPGHHSKPHVSTEPKLTSIVRYHMYV